MADCKYGDPTCPCRDGDMCHYKAGVRTPAMPVPAKHIDAVLSKKDVEAEHLQASLKWAVKNLEALTINNGHGVYIRGTNTELAGFGEKLEEAYAALSMEGANDGRT